jgi:imidazoleglycerol phosphate synthase cyclase subunit
MLTARVIPCLDVRDGRVVKGTRFQDLRDMGDPAELAARYEDQGADEIVLLDVAATNAGRETALATVAAVRARLGIPLTVGGGVSTGEHAGQLLAAGADKVSVNSAAIARPDLVGEIASQYGRQCCVVAVDAARRDQGWCALTHAGTRETRPDAIAWIAEAVARGAGEILLTSWDEDGRGQGYDLALLQAARAAVTVPLIASGGGRTAVHLAGALDAGASAVLVASVLHGGQTTVSRLKQSLIAKGQAIRP